MSARTNREAEKIAPAARIKTVLPGSAAAAAGLKPGDIVKSLGGRSLRDVIDYQFYLEPGVNKLRVERSGRSLAVELDADPANDAGIVFGSVLFNGIKTCRNHCLFCFVDQLPSGMRRQLYLKDDDFRLSFLHGNFITLNGIGAAGLARIKAQRLSPLYVSVHATDAEVRGRVMGCSPAASAAGLEKLQQLGEAGIRLHAQVVLCPGINDGAVLERTVHELGRDFRGVASVGVVPVALAAGFASRLKEDAGSALGPVSANGCRDIVASVDSWQEDFRRRGAGFVYAADEFYLQGGLPLPAAAQYDDFPQYENGIGIAAGFIDDLPALANSLSLTGLPPGRVFLLCGRLAAPLIEFACGKLTRLTGGSFQPLVAKNRLFGPHATVTGLLGGRDIAAAAEAGLARGDLLLIPPSCLESSGRRFLDDMSLAELKQSLACEVRVDNPVNSKADLTNGR